MTRVREELDARRLCHCLDRSFRLFVVVLDVGTGSGILAYFAVKAGARKVYAVEASDVADRAKILMQAAGLSDRIIVIKCKASCCVGSRFHFRIMFCGSAGGAFAAR